MHSSIVRWPLVAAVLALGAEAVAQGGPALPDPGAFERTRGQMQTPRVAFGAAALAHERALIAGGQDANAMATATAEIYNAKQQTFVPTASPMSEERAFARR